MMRPMRFAQLLAAALFVSPALAQEQAQPGDDVISNSASATVKLAPVDPAKRKAEELDKLMGQLQAQFPRDADALQQKIWTLWMSNPSPTAELLLRQATKAKNDGAFEPAEKILNTLIGTEPAFAEAYNKRAALYYLQKRYDEALDDLDQALDLEPRHFGALAGRAMVYHAQGKFGLAATALEEAIAINPHDAVAKDVLKSIQNQTPGI